MRGLKIDIVKNGFVVFEDTKQRFASNDIWVFQNAEALSDFIHSWAEADEVKKKTKGLPTWVDKKPEGLPKNVKT